MATVTQRVCTACRNLTPATEPACSQCGAPFRSDLRWKVPLIVLLFALALAISVAIELYA